MITIISDAWYCVMLAQLPPGGISCAAGDPGVGFGQLYTDDVNRHGDHANAGHAGRHRHWVSAEGPLGTSNQLTGDLGTSDYVAAI